MVDNYKANINEASDFIKSKTSVVPELGLILGSGLGELANEIQDATIIPYSEIPHFMESTAPAHVGRLVIGKLNGKNVVAMQGRLHLYEGYSAKEVTLPVRVMKALGAKTLITTCAAGGLNRNFKAGSFMLINDHINFTGQNCLTGPNDNELGVRFPVMFDSYSPNLRELAKKVALENKINLHEGVYFGIAGPVFFTRAELRLAIQLGGDAVGMSIVQEVITAVHSGMKVLGISNITDMALPDIEHHATEQDVIDMAKQAGPSFRHLIKSILAEME